MPLIVSKPQSFKKIKPRLAMKLHYLMHGYQKARSARWVHASDITDTDFCPREFALIWKYRPEAKRPSKAISTSLQYTFGTGTLLGDALINMWGTELMRGIWVCNCGAKTLPFSPKPEACLVCQGKNFKHKETYGNLFGRRFTYAPDVFVDLGEEKLRVVELKTIKSEGDGFKELQGPRAAHALRTAYYMESLKRNGFGDRVYTDEAIILYLCKGYGYKDEAVGGYGIKMDRTTPFKEYRVYRRDYQEEIDLMFKVIEGIARVTEGQVDPIIPDRIPSCDALKCKRARNCPVADICWGVK